MSNNSLPSDAADLAGFNVLVTVTGGIAAYKVCEVVSRLAQHGVTVTVAMTRAAQQFVGLTTFEALTGRRVLTDMFVNNDPSDVQHIALTQAADLILVAPATANIIGKIAGGIADDLVSTLVISADSPVVLAPAMNSRMWNNPIVQKNIRTLKEFDYQMIDPGEGWLACRTVGPGRMAEPVDILETVTSVLKQNKPKGA
jgi:phosphopantothenoylcysteine decarboxylase/phosphopantothenate--cysteine ligase